MCRAFTILELEKGRKDEAKFQTVLNYVVNAKNKFNKDGYFLSVDGNSFRTLDYEKFLEFVIKNEDAINSANVVNGHLRLATAGDVIDKWVHGWNFKGYECFHNGCLHEYKTNDSYEFFSKVKKFTVKGIIKTAKENSGWGVFMMIDPNGKKFIVSKSTDINVHVMNDHFLAINSNEDVHDLNSEVELESRIEYVTKGILVFDKNTDRKISVGDYVLSDLKQSYKDCVIVFDKHNSPVDITAIEDGYVSVNKPDYSYNSQSNEHKWFSDEEIKAEKKLKKLKKKNAKKRNKDKKKMSKKDKKKQATTSIGKAMEENYQQGWSDGYLEGLAYAEQGTVKDFETMHNMRGGR